MGVRRVLQLKRTNFIFLECLIVVQFTTDHILICLIKIVVYFVAD